jgi:transcription elongation GreA/GreB family factor
MLQDARIQPAEAATVMLSQADYDATVRELETLRTAYHANLAALEDVTIDELRIAHLKRLLASATVVAGPETLGAATLGSVVRVRKETGAVVDYTLVGRRAPDSPPTHVTPASPVGKALLGARRGDVATVLLPSGRGARLEVLDVRLTAR